MTAQRTLTTPVRSQTAPPGAGPDDAASGTLLEMAQGFAQVAREAYQNCERGKDAVTELQRRRNRSGQ